MQKGWKENFKYALRKYRWHVHLSYLYSMFSTHNGDTIHLQKEMHNHFSKIAYRSPDFIIPHSLSENKNEALFIVLSKRFPPNSNPISIHVFGRTKIHLTVLRHRATTPTHQVALITTITRAACGSGLHPRSCGNPPS